MGMVAVNKQLMTETLLTNKELFIGTVHANSELLPVTDLANKVLLTRTVPVNNHFHKNIEAFEICFSDFFMSHKIESFLCVTELLIHLESLRVPPSGAQIGGARGGMPPQYFFLGRGLPPQFC